MRDAILMLLMPKEIPLGTLRVTLHTDDAARADPYFNYLADRIEREFIKKQKVLGVFYTLQMELEGVAVGSRRYLAKPKLTLKQPWRMFRPVSIAIGSVLAAVGAYPTVKDGAAEIYNDFKTAVNYVVENERSQNPEMAPIAELCRPSVDETKSKRE